MCCAEVSEENWIENHYNNRQTGSVIALSAIWPTGPHGQKLDYAIAAAGENVTVILKRPKEMSQKKDPLRNSTFFKA